MNKQLHKQNLKFDIKDIKEYIEDLNKEYRAHQREARKTFTKIRRERKRLWMKEHILKSL